MADLQPETYPSIPFDLSDPDRAPFDVFAAVQTHFEAEMVDGPWPKQFARACCDLHGWPRVPMVAELRRRLESDQWRFLLRSPGYWTAWHDIQLAEALRFRSVTQVQDLESLRGLAPCHVPLPWDPDFKVTLEDGTVITINGD